MAERVTILDGAMGTLMQRAGLGAGERPELFGMAYPDAVTAAHRQYIEAGSRVIYSNTFGANPRKLAGTGVSCAQAVRAGVGAAIAARELAGAAGVRVALDVGPLGEAIAPLGSLSFDAAYEQYAQMMRAGEQAGAELIVCETFTDLADLRAAILAAREQTSLPVWATMSFEATGRTFMGVSPRCFAACAEGLGVEALGVNCSLGPAALTGVVAELLGATDLPVIVKPNAGLPDPRSGGYDLRAEDFAAQMAVFADMGAAYLGGCCGTAPEYIRAISGLAGRAVPARAGAITGPCSATRMAMPAGVPVVGERLNPTGKKRLQRALREGDGEYLARTALEQASAGAELLDINVGLPGLDEPAAMRRAVGAVQASCPLPLQIDSSDPAAIEAGLRAFHGVAVINSVNGSEASLAAVLPLARKYGAFLIGLTMDERGIPKTAQERFGIAQRILRAAEAAGIRRDRLIIDCLTLTVSAQQEQAAETLRAVRMVRDELGLHCALGVSNISFGLPAREKLSSVFLAQALAFGVDFPIIDPTQPAMMDAVAAHRALFALDAGCAGYIARFGSSAAPAAAKADMSIEQAISLGLREEARAIAETLLETVPEMELVSSRLIPALDAVGADYERGRIFLPQLISASAAASAAFDAVRARVAARGAQGVSAGRIVIATVRGDLHDIGKNIVKVILENYGYEVIDLGRDVPPERVVASVVENGVRLVGLSALMTTTLPAMAETIRALRACGCDCRIWVGGAVLTEQSALELGADFYARDARASVEIAKKVLGGGL